IPKLERFVEADASDRHSLLALGRYYLQDGRPDMAAAALRRAFSQRPGDVVIRAHLAEALLGLSDLGGARQMLADAPALPDSPCCVWISHGSYWMAVGDWPRAVACLTRAVALSPNDVALRLKLKKALELSGDGLAAGPHLERQQLLVDLRLMMHRFVELE